MDRIVSMSSFVKVVDCGGFSAAARRLNLSPTMVSNHIQALENRLGVRLLNRTTRKVSLTELGRAYYERCVQILAEMDDADQVAVSLHAMPRGTLRLNISPALAPITAPFIAQFTRENSEVKVEEIMTDHMVDMVEEGFDLAIRVTPVSESRLIVRRLGTYRRVLCGAPSYFAERGMPSVPGDLSKHVCLSYSHDAFAEEWRFTGPGGPQTVRISGTLRTNSPVGLREAALLAHGLILAPSFMVGDELRAGRLIAVLTEFLTSEYPINAFYPHRHHLTAKVRSFINLLIERFPDWGNVAGVSGMYSRAEIAQNQRA